MNAGRSAKVVIDAWFAEYPFPNFLDPIRKCAAEFEQAHPEYRVDIRGHGYEEIPAEVSRAALEGHPPTIASYYSGSTQQARDTVTREGRPLFTTVERALAGRTEVLGEPVVIDELVPATRGFYTIDGEYTSMPLTLSTMIMYVNTTVLRAAGVRGVPGTWAEVDAACEAVAALPGGPSHGITWPVDGKLFQEAIAQQGGLLVNNDNGRNGRATAVDLTSPQMMAYVGWWQQLSKNGYYLYTGALEDWERSFACFAEQRVAIRFGSSFDAKYMIAAGQAAGFEVEVAPMPYNGRVPRVGNWIGGDSLWLAAGLDRATEDGALAFMQYLCNARNAADFHKANGSTPISRPAVELLRREGWFERDPYHRVATEQLERTDGSPASHAPLLGGSHGLQLAIMQAMEDVLVRDAEPLARFTRAAAEAQQALEQYNADCLGPGPRDPRWLIVGT